MTYRTGNHWGVTIVRESLVPNDNYGEHDQLVAVVVNGDRELAERICALLNADGIPEPYRPPHPTCIDVTAIGKPPRSEWACGPRCPPDDRKATAPDQHDQPAIDCRCLMCTHLREQETKP